MWRISWSNSIIKWQDYRVAASGLAESNFRYTRHRNTCPKHFSLDQALSSSGPVLTGENRGLECGGHWLVSFPKIISARSDDAIRTDLEWQ